MTHRLVRLDLYAAWAGNGRVVKLGDLPRIIDLPLEQILERFGPLSAESDLDTDQAARSTGTWHWQLRAEKPEPEGASLKLTGTLVSDGTTSNNLDTIARADLPNYFVPAGWVDRALEAWEAGIRSIKLEDSGPNTHFPGTLLTGKDEIDSIWCLRGILSDDTIYSGPNPLNT